MKNITENKKGNFRKLTALISMLLMCLMVFSLTGCSGKSVDLEKGGNSDVTLKQALESNPDALWLYVKDIDKDEDVRYAFQFSDKGVKIYVFHKRPSLGEATQMTAEEIILMSREQWNANIEEQIERFKDVYSGDDNALAILEQGWNDFKRNYTIPDAFIGPVPYELQIFTDSSGNYTEEERIVFNEPVLEYDFEGYDWIEGYGNGIVLEMRDRYWDAHYGGYMGNIYDTEYIGFATDNGYLITAGDPEITLTLDEPGTEGIAVDPKK